MALPSLPFEVQALDIELARENRPNLTESRVAPARFASALAECAAHGLSEEARGILHLCVMQGLRPEMDNYLQYAQALEKSGQWKDIASLLGPLQDAGVGQEEARMCLAAAAQTGESSVILSTLETWTRSTGTSWTLGPVEASYLFRNAPTLELTIWLHSHLQQHHPSVMDSRNVALVVKALGRGGPMYTERLLECLKQYSWPPSSSSSSIPINQLLKESTMVIRALVRHQRMLEAEELVRHLESISSPNAPRVDEMIYASLCQGYLSQQDVQGARKVMSRMIDQGIQPTPVTLRIFLGGYAKLHTPDQVEALIQEIEKDWGITLPSDPEIWALRLSALAQVNLTKATRAFGELGTHGIPYRITHYIPLLAGYLRAGDMAAVEAAYTHYRAHRATTNAQGLVVLVRTFLAAGEIDRAQRAFDDLLGDQEDGEAQASPWSLTSAQVYTLLIQAHGRRRDTESVTGMVGRLRLDPGVELDAQLGTTILNAYGWCRDVPNLLKTWDWLREIGLARDPVSLSVFLDACGRNGLYGKARYVWMTLVEGPVDQVKQENMTQEEMMGMGNEEEEGEEGREKEEEEDEEEDEIAREKDLLTPRSLNAYVECLARCRDFDEALAVLQRVMMGPLGPTMTPEEEITFRHTLFKLYSRIRRHQGEAASKPLEEWVQRDFPSLSEPFQWPPRENR
ncbi:MAG: hypothetical protein DHS80DRAFT_25586 [Piptocephalis tieghemiana]|nr:MAG: hypothetical protein DHS80DRAFT_25586 [Piptocephalis tieghemiana]